MNEQEVDSVLDDIFGEVSSPTGEGLTKRECQKLLIKEMNSVIYSNNLNRLRHGQFYVAAPFKGLRQINQAVFMARQIGGYEELLKNAGFN